MRQQLRQPDEGPVGQKKNKRATLMEYLLKKRELDNSSKLDQTRAKGSLSEKNTTMWRACNLTEFTHSSTGPVVQPFASRHEGAGFNPGGYLCETRILLLALSRYIGDPDVIDHCGLV